MEVEKEKEKEREREIEKEAGKEFDASLVPSAELAYLGDAVLEVLVRERIVKSERKKGERPSDMALMYVTAKAQSDAVARIEGLLTEEEEDVYRRGRNNYHTSNVPKSATVAQYRRATGLEALFGYLHLTGKKARAEELFKKAYGL